MKISDELNRGSKIFAVLHTLFSFIYSCVTSTRPLFLLYPAGKSESGLNLVRSLVVSASIITMTDSISETAVEQIGAKSSSEQQLLLEYINGLLSIATHKKLRSRYMALYLC
jgi:hypothetical protein